MLDRLAVELLHALAKNPGAVPVLQTEADELLGCVSAWLATIDRDELPMGAELVGAEIEPSTLAQTLHDLGEHLLILADIRRDKQRGPLMAAAFDPLSFADALEVLRTEIEVELSASEAQIALTVLRNEIAFVAAQARTWAIERGARFDFIDAPPDCDAVDCILVLRSLADALRELASRDALRVVNDNATPGEGEDDD
jgi:hypothetical protein